MEDLFSNQIIKEKLSQEALKELALGFHGEIKVVADLKRGVVAAGAQWHAHSRDLLMADGGEPEDMWGARVDIRNGKIEFRSQINTNRHGVDINEIMDTSIRKDVEELIRKFLV